METVEERIKQAARQMGAQAVGIAAAAEFHSHVPDGFRPGDYTYTMSMESSVTRSRPYGLTMKSTSTPIAPSPGKTNLGS